MIIAILWLIFKLALAVGIVELIFWFLSMIFAGFIITSRVRGIVYLLLFILFIIYALKIFGIV